MSSWLCSSGSQPISFCNSKYRQGRLPDEHNQLDTLYVDATLDVMHCIEKSSPNLYKSYLFHEKSKGITWWTNAPNAFISQTNGIFL